MNFYRNKIINFSAQKPNWISKHRASPLVLKLYVL